MCGYRWKKRWSGWGNERREMNIKLNDGFIQRCALPIGGFLTCQKNDKRQKSERGKEPSTISDSVLYKTGIILHIYAPPAVRELQLRKVCCFVFYFCHVYLQSSRHGPLKHRTLNNCQRNNTNYSTKWPRTTIKIQFTNSPWALTSSNKKYKWKRTSDESRRDLLM